jgi:hypothetical protein
MRRGRFSSIITPEYTEGADVHSSFPYQVEVEEYGYIQGDGPPIWAYQTNTQQNEQKS